MPRKPAFPNPAAKLPGEADVLANVLADLSDHDAKLVYADWLEEQGDKRGPLLRNFVTAYRGGKKLTAIKSAPKSWRDLVGLTLMAQLRDSAFAPKADQLLALARPALNYRITNASEKSLPVGTSKFGGRPDMPAGSEWPKYKGQPLSLVAQLNLADLRTSPVCRELPAAGLLSFFLLHDEDRTEDDFPKGTFRVIHFPDTSKLVRHEFEEDADEPWLSSCRLEFTESLALPHTDSPWTKELKRLAPEDDGVAYENLHDGFTAEILGYPSPLHGDILGKKTVRHLLTVGEGVVDWGWLDGDVVYFTVPEDDLKQGRFDRVKMTLETF